MNRPLPAILLMVLAMACFAIADALIKLVAGALPVAQVLLLITSGSLIIFVGLAILRGEPLYGPHFWNRHMVLRNMADAIGTASSVVSLALAPLVQVIAITQVLPVFVTIGAVFILGETVGWRRWIAVGVGLLGVLIILRPGADLQPGALFALLAAIGLALRDVFTRKVPKDVALLQLVIWGLVFIAPSAAILLVLDGRSVMPTPGQWLYLGCAVLAATVAYLAITASVRLAEVSAITPFRYSRLIFGTALGVILFDETLDGPTIAGATLIVAAGLFILLRERRTAPLPRAPKTR